MLIERRCFLKAAASIAPAATLHELMAQVPAPAAWLEPHPVGAGQDRFGQLHSLGVSSLAFKVGGSETSDRLFIIEHSNLAPGGPPLHLHYNQEEWFYVMQGEVAFQVGEQRLHLRSGESMLTPRQVPHTFSAVAEGAHMLIAFCPAGKMEQYFRDGDHDPKLAASEDFMNRYEMKWLGPSPFWKS